MVRSWFSIYWKGILWIKIYLIVLIKYRCVWYSYLRNRRLLFRYTGPSSRRDTSWWNRIIVWIIFSIIIIWFLWRIYNRTFNSIHRSVWILTICGCRTNERLGSTRCFGCLIKRFVFIFIIINCSVGNRWLIRIFS